jgi:CMP-N-acetylneuraminic acid synthetase
MIDVVKHAIEWYEHFEAPEKIDAVCLLQPTSPLRTHEDIDNAIKLFEESDANSLYSGYYMGIKHKDKAYDKHTSEKHFQRNGAIFIAKRKLIEQGKLWDDTVIEYEMPLSRSIDIDTIDDMRIADALLQYRAKGGQI